MTVFKHTNNSNHKSPKMNNIDQNTNNSSNKQDMGLYMVLARSAALPLQQLVLLWTGGYGRLQGPEAKRIPYLEFRV